jgi:hypothetical protein
VINIPAEEKLDAVGAERTAVLQKQSLMNTLASVRILALELTVERLHQQAVCLLLGNNLRVLDDESLVGSVVIGLELCKLLGQWANLNVGGIIIIIVLLSSGGRGASSTRIEELHLSFLGWRSGLRLWLGLGHK